VSHSFSLHSFIRSFIHGDSVFDHCEEKRREEKRGEERELHLGKKRWIVLLFFE
jgi:hypothetical protein